MDWVIFALLLQFLNPFVFIPAVSIIGYYIYNKNKLNSYLDIYYPELEMFKMDVKTSKKSILAHFFVNLNTLELKEISTLTLSSTESHIFRNIKLYVNDNKLCSYLEEEIIYTKDTLSNKWIKNITVKDKIINYNETIHSLAFDSHIDFNNRFNHLQQEINSYNLIENLKSYLLIRIDILKNNNKTHSESIKHNAFTFYNNKINSKYDFLD